MRNDVPAAVPLIALIAGLALGPWLVNPWLVVAGVILAAALARRPVVGMFLALGIALALHVEMRTAREKRAFAQLDDETFVVVEVPLERDWTEREESFVLRASRFRADGEAFDAPLAVYARFEPPQIAMEATMRAEGFLRINDRGDYTMSIKSPRLLAYEGRLAWWHPGSWNRALANRLEPHAREHPNEVALAQALVLGRGERLTKEMRESFRRGGTYHLLVFSGLQIAFAAALLAALLRWLHRPRASDWLLLAFAALAPPFIGPTASVSRASTGIALYALSRIARRPTSMENLWCVAALLRLILEPRDLTDASFHLTYAGAGALLFVGKHLLERKWLAHAVAAEVAIAPLTLFHFHQYAIGGSLLTLLMSPLIFAMLILSLLACAIPGTALFGAIAALHRLCGLLNAGGLSGFFAAPPTIASIAGASAALFALAFLRERARAIAIVAAMLIPTGASIVRFVSVRSVDHPRVTFLDVGQGDSIAIRSGTKTILVDGGRDTRLLPMLADRGIRRIEAVVLTHAHPDHCGALAPLIEQFDVGAVHVSARRFRGECAADLLAACSASHTPIHVVRDGDVFAMPGVRFRAHVADRTFRRAAENNASVVLHGEVGGRTFLLTGDIEKEAELYFEDRALRADVLKVAHHGSRSSTSERWLDLVTPRIAVISCGRRNLFGHPHPAVLEVLASRSIRTWRTDQDGSIDVEVQGRNLYVQKRFD